MPTVDRRLTAKIASRQGHDRGATAGDDVLGGMSLREPFRLARSGSSHSRGQRLAPGRAWFAPGPRPRDSRLLDLARLVRQPKAAGLCIVLDLRAVDLAGERYFDQVGPLDVPTKEARGFDLGNHTGSI